jgi:hypothetical protein
MYKIKRIDIPSAALYSFIVFLILGIIIFLPIGILFSVVSNVVPQTGLSSPFYLPVFSGVFFILAPVFYAFAGMITSVVITVIYKLISLKLGAIKLELKKVE